MLRRVHGCTLPIQLWHLGRGETGDLTFIVGARGRAFVKDAFGNEFSAAARAAGIRKSAHGVRKIAAELAAEAGATEHELDAVVGWIDGKTSRTYHPQGQPQEDGAYRRRQIERFGNICSRT